MVGIVMMTAIAAGIVTVVAVGHGSSLSLLFLVGALSLSVCLSGCLFSGPSVPRFGGGGGMWGV